MMNPNPISVNTEKRVKDIFAQPIVLKENSTRKSISLLYNNLSTTGEALRARWPEILQYAATKNHIDSLYYRMYFYPMVVDSIDIENPSHWNIKVKMVDFDKNLDVYVQLTYSEIIENAVKDIIGIDCSISIYSEGCKGSKCLNFIKSAGRKIVKFMRGGCDKKDKAITEAMTLFGINTLDEISKDELKHKRNKLLKVYHPDENNYNSRYAEIINNSYSILLKYAV